MKKTGRPLGPQRRGFVTGRQFCLQDGICERIAFARCRVYDPILLVARATTPACLRCEVYLHISRHKQIPRVKSRRTDVREYLAMAMAEASL